MPGAVSLTLALCVAAAARAGAQPSIVVPWDGANTFTCATGTESLCGQSFTVPASATVLQSFRYDLSTSNVLTFELFALSGTQVVGPALFTDVIGPTAGFQALTFTPAGGLALTGGAPYAALVRLDPGEEVVFRSNLLGVYPGGVVLAGCQVDCVVAPREVDLAFTATFVPEPATLGLLAVGLAALGAAAGRRRV